MSRLLTRGLPALALLVLLSSVVDALINPNFTPIHLVTQSGGIAVVECPKPGSAAKISAKVVKRLKGKAAGYTLTIDLAACPKIQQKAVRANLAAWAGKPAILFEGEFLEEGKVDKAPDKKAFLHVNGLWVVLRSGAGGAWAPTGIDKAMQATWAGGTDMLLRATNYILTDEDPGCPVNAMVAWDETEEVGEVEGKVRWCEAVDLDGKGNPYLFVASSEGDRLFRYDGDAEEWTDATAGRKLISKSACGAWVDLDGDGRLDLLSWDGNAFGLQLQQQDGTFAAAADTLPAAPAGGCLGIAAVDCGQKGRAGVLITTTGAPLLLSPADGKLAARPLPGGGGGGDLGRPGACIVADLDGDALPDILRPFERGSLLYRGKAPGDWAAPVRCAVALGKAGAASCVGDYDADGMLDIFTGGELANRMWQNRGKGLFEECLGLTGELDYISKAEALVAQTCDVNNDGRQDLFLAYAGNGAQIFFNRGFRSFGHAHALDLTEKGLLQEATGGQQSGCMADFNSDGAQDMVIIAESGAVWSFWRESEEEDSLALLVDLAPECGFAGPLAVTGWAEERCLGTWNVVPGTSKALVGILEAGPCTVKWRLPGGKEKEKEFILEDRPRRFTIK